MDSHIFQIGFTGTQRGMNAKQFRNVYELLRHRRFVAHHGDCIGADTVFDTIARRSPGFVGIVLHPPSDPSKRAFVTLDPRTDVARAPRPYLDRNQNIIDDVEILLAAPKTDYIETRSGTWATYRRGMQARHRLAIALVLPCGAVALDGSSWPF